MKPKILFIITLPPPIHGSSIMCEYIKKSKLISSSYTCSYVNLSTSRRVSEIGKKTPIKIIRFFTSYFKVMVLLVRYHYDTCYISITCHGTGFLKDAPFVLLCKLFCKNIILHQHNKGMSMDVDKPFYHWLFKRVYKHTKVFLLSWNLYPDVERIVQKEQIIICPNGISCTLKNIDIKLKHNNVPNILFLSNLIDSKGIYILLDACKILKEKNIPFTCTFIGAESKEVSASLFINEISKRGLNGLVKYVGKKYYKEKDDYFKNADIFVLPTFYDNECFPLVLIEAMQYKLPVISTYEGGIPDIVIDGETGYLCSQRDTNSLTKQLANLLSDKELRMNMGEAGRKRYEKYFTLEVWEKKLISFLLTK